MKKSFFYFMILYPFILANYHLSNSNHIPEDFIFSIFSFIPREIRYLEVLFIMCLLMYVIALKGKNLSPFSLNIIWSTIVIVIIGIIGGLLHNSLFGSIFQNLVLFLEPLLIIVISYELRYSRKHITKYMNFLIGIAFLMIPFSIYQFVFIRPLAKWQADIVVGLLEHSHSYATYNYFISSIFFLKLLYEVGKKKINVLLFVFFFIFGFIGFNEKNTIFYIILLLLFLADHNRGKVGFYLLLFIATYFIFNLLVIYQQVIDLRIDSLIEEKFSELGIVLSYLRLPEIFINNPNFLVFGAGSGNFGTPVVRGVYALTGYLPELAKKYNYFTILGGAGGISGAQEWTMNLITGFLVEFGLIAFVVYFSVLRKIINKLFNLRRNIGFNFIVGSLLFFWSLLFMNSVVSDLYGLTSPFLIFPLSFMTGLTISNFNQMRK